MMAAPWLKFYPSDWRSESSLRMCSMAARGLWMELLCLMHEADGLLLVNGNKVSSKQLSVLCGCTIKEVDALMRELEEAGVFSRSDDGTAFSRRITRDIAKAKADKENGGKGGNPNLRKGVNPPIKPTDNGADKAQKPEARIQKENKPAQLPVAESDPPNDLDRAQAACCAALGGKAPADLVIGPMIEVFREFGEARVLEALRSEARRSRQKPIKSWRLWATIIREALAGAPKTGVSQSAEKSKAMEEYREKRWREALAEWCEKGRRMSWDENALGGGRPDEPGCGVPDAILAEFGLTRVPYPKFEELDAE